MGRIQNYSKDTEVTANDKWVGSDFENYGSTKNFTPTSIAKYLNDNNVINIGSDLRYRYQTLDPGEVRNIGTLSFESEIGASVLFSSITTFLLSKRSLKQNDVSQYLQFLNGGSIIINSADNQNFFGFYKVIGLTEYVTDRDFYVVTLEYIDGNGSIVEDTDYIFSLITDKYSNTATEQVNSDWNSTSGVSEILNKPIIPSIAGLATESYVNSRDDLKVDKIAGKGLSTNDYTALEKDKLAGIASGAEVNVNADWNATSGDALILNKPTIPSLSGYVPYTGATSDVNIGAHSLTSDELILNTSPTKTLTAPGQMIWNDVDGTLDVRLKGNNVTLQVGQENVVRIVNKTGVDLLESNYQAVRVRLVSEGGAAGQRLAVVLAQANNDPNSATTIGLVTENINNNQEGFITTNGQVREINTTGSLQGETWVDGDMLYLSGTTAGRLTNIKPAAPIHTIIIGYVEYAHAVHGKIFVKVDNGYELDELHNVSISSVANNDLIQYDSALSLWKNKSLSAAGIQPTLPTLTSGSVLFSNGTTIAQDNAALFWDNTNKSLKLSAAISSNTEAPLVVKNLTAYSAPNYNQYAQLWKNSTDTVMGYFRADGRLYTSNSVNTNYFTGNIAGTNAAPVLSAATGYGVLFPGLNSVAISTASAERLRVDAVGGVGINTSTISTNSKLHVLGGITQQNPNSNGITSAATAANSLVFNRSGNTVNNFYAGYAFGGYLSLGYTGDSFSTYLPILNLSTNGNVGMGVANASRRLEIKDDVNTAQLSLLSATGVVSIEGLGGATLLSYDTTSGGVYTYGPITMNPGVGLITYAGQDVLYGTLTDGYLPKKSTLGVSNSNIYDDGFLVGIGTNVPVTELDVNGVITATGGNSTSWNAKQDAITLTTTGTSGPATLVGSTLNIPNYAVGGSSGIHCQKIIASGQYTNLYVIYSSGTTTSVMSANRLYCMPFFPNQTFTTQSLGINVTTLSVGGLAKILIFSDVDGIPTTKLYESADFDCSTLGNKTASVSFTFTAGTTYWLSVVSNNSTTALTALSQGAVYAFATTGAFSSSTYGYLNSTYASIPSTLTTLIYQSGNIPMISIRKA